MSEPQPTLDIRASMLTAYADCALRAAVAQWPDEFVGRGHKLNPTKTSMPAAVGIGAHAAVRKSLTEKLLTGLLGNTDDAIQAGIEEFEKQIANGYTTDEITKTPGAGHDQIAKITRVYNGLVGYKIQPLHVEQKFTMSFRKFAPGYTGSGSIDNITTALELSDLKTGRRASTFAYIYQIGFYSVLLRSNGIIPALVGTITIPRPAAHEDLKEPKINWFDRADAEAVAAEMTGHIIRDFEAFKPNGNVAVFRKNPNSFLCSNKTCSAWFICPFGRAKDKTGS